MDKLTKKTNCVIFDLDGTLAHHNNKRDIFDWDNVGLDEVDDVVRETLITFHGAGYNIIIVSGRDGRALKGTELWLTFNDIPFDEIFLKDIRDNRKDVVFKTNVYENHLKEKYNILCVFEDRKRVVDMWRGLGIKCFQVKDEDN
jgi:phosphoglycolate phosphatase-like HAD superfamily hydrolase